MKKKEKKPKPRNLEFLGMREKCRHKRHKEKQDIAYEKGYARNPKHKNKKFG